MSILREFKEFAMRGNMVDMAVGIIIGAAFGSIVKSLVDDVIMPPIGMLLGGVDFSQLFLVIKSGTPPPPYFSVAAAKQAGAVTINYGLFINSMVSFLIIAFSVFMIIKLMNTVTAKLDRSAKADAPTTRDCPFCLSTVPLRATRCPHCTSELPPA